MWLPTSQRLLGESRPLARAICAALLWTTLAVAQEPASLGAESAAAVPVHPDTPGVVTGHVLSKDTGESLDYTNIVFHRLDDYGRREQVGGTIALSKGYYVYRCAPGRYAISFIYIGYERLVREIQVEPGQTLVEEVQLKIKPVEMQTYTVQATAIQNTERSLLAQQRSAAVVSDALSSEQISRGADSDAAEALERVTGLTVVGNKYVFVRGLGDRYSQTQLNGATLSAPEPNKRTVPLDIFPSGLLENVVIHKTFTPDMDGEFGGGVVNVNTRDALQRREMSQRFGIGYSESVLDMGTMDYPGGARDWLAYDDGSRALPGGIPDERIRKRLAYEPEGVAYTRDDLRQMKSLFRNVWVPRGGGSRPNYNYGGHYADGFKLLGREIGFLGSATLSNSFHTEKGRIDREYRNSIEDAPLRDYRVDQSTASSLFGLTGSLSMNLARDHVLKFNSLWTRSADDRARHTRGLNSDFGTDVETFDLAFTERELKSQVLYGKHALPGRSIVDWVGGYSESYFGEPDRRTSFYELDPGSGEVVVSPRPANPFVRVFGASEELDRSGKVNYAVPLVSQGYFQGTQFKLGIAHRNRDRASAYRRFGIKCPGGVDCREIDLSKSPEELLDPEGPYASGFELSESTKANDAWQGGYETSAGYAMLDLVAGRTRLTGGLRLERSDLYVSARSPYAIDDPGLRLRRRFEDGLPSANLSYRLSDTQSLRLGYSKTLNRPELREVSPFSMYNYNENVNEQGNPDLVQARLHSYDLRWEMYPGLGQLLAVSAFYKELRHPIEYLILGGTGEVLRQPQNADSGILRGMEFELRMPIGELLWLASYYNLNIGSFWDRFTLSANHSRIFSEVHLQIPGETRRGTLTGQSDESTNVGLFYDGHVYDASLQYKFAGPRLYAFGLGALPDVYEHPASSLDLTLARKLFQFASLKFSLENLANDPTDRLQGDAIYQHWLEGRRYGLSISFNR